MYVHFMVHVQHLVLRIKKSRTQFAQNEHSKSEVHIHVIAHKLASLSPLIF